MASFASTHVTGDDWRQLCTTVAKNSRGAGDLAFVYIAEQFASQASEIIDCLRERSGIAHWVGCVGMGLCSNGLETYDEPGLCVLTTPLRADEFRTLPGATGKLDDWLAATATWRAGNLASIGVVHGDPGDPSLAEQLAGLSDALHGGFLVGGVASAETNAVHVADDVLTGRLSGVVLSGAVEVHTGLTQGCSLIGTKHEVSRSTRNVIEQIDGRPALDVLKQDIGEMLARDLSRIGGYIFAALPIRGSDTGDYLVRNLVGIDTERGLVAIGDLVSPGMDIQFARRDANTARDDLVRMVNELRERLPAPPRGGLYHTCLGRGRYLFGDDSAEMRLIGESLGDVPLAGFYANGEISHNRLYGYTGVLTLFT